MLNCRHRHRYTVCCGLALLMLQLKNLSAAWSHVSATYSTTITSMNTSMTSVCAKINAQIDEGKVGHNG